MPSGAPNYRQLGVVDAKQSGDWSVGQVGAWAVNATQAGAWLTTTKEYAQEAGIKVREKLIICVKNTAESSPTSTDITLMAGNIRRIQIVVPSGHAGLTGLRLEQATNLLVPSEATEWFKGDQQALDLMFDYDMVVELGVYKVVAKTFNTDDTYDHSWAVRIWIKPA